ncbi:transmembrane signal receptor [Lithospermum erythrorhizon]|uniref:Transmembrane signal receptor n=1 Tax=Lithospermum erythrorhizon TaxID=34254 RepID=A0AAV3P9N8_LITER
MYNFMSESFRLQRFSPGYFDPCHCRTWGGGGVVHDSDDEWDVGLVQSLAPPAVEPTPSSAAQPAATDVPLEGAESSSVASRVSPDAVEGPDSTVLTEVEPCNFTEAISDPGWCEAMAKEIDALEANGTWVMAPLPPNKKALGCKWVYKIKYNAYGTIERLKARLVILGNYQVAGIDYHETFASVVKMVTVRTFLAVAASRNWALHQMDVHNAFLHGDLNDEVYMKVPPGFYVGQTGMMCKLQKSLYGLRQDPHYWFAKIAASLLCYGCC